MFRYRVSRPSVLLPLEGIRESPSPSSRHCGPAAALHNTHLSRENVFSSAGPVFDAWDLDTLSEMRQLGHQPIY